MGSGVYVMHTLRLDFHMGSVECVTCQVPLRKDKGGAVNVLVVEEGRVDEVVGARSVIY